MQEEQPNFKKFSPRVANALDPPLPILRSGHN